jgi:hypothetical protein
VGVLKRERERERERESEEENKKSYKFFLLSTQLTQGGRLISKIIFIKCQPFRDCDKVFFSIL